MPARIGINGFGRMGRLLRAGWGRPDLQFVHINEVAGGPETAAHLLTFDSVHGRWDRHVEPGRDQIAIDGTAIGFSDTAAPADVPWLRHQVDIVLEPASHRRLVHDQLPRARSEGDSRIDRRHPRCDHHDPRHHEHADRRRCSTQRPAPRSSEQPLVGSDEHRLGLRDRPDNRVIELAQKVGASL
jgi:glyceraldehyde 3-phosphate dehydrogenase-like protein